MLKKWRTEKIYMFYFNILWSFKLCVFVPQFFGELLVSNQMRFGCPPALTLSSIILFFNGLSKVRFVTGSEQYMLPMLVTAMAKQPELKQLLADYAEYVKQSLEVILTRCFQVRLIRLFLTVCFKKKVPKILVRRTPWRIWVSPK